ncbi:inorganic triphosphatase [Sinorhizobium sp. BJ1]|uniref:CYTH and CHAD domain-containing protein n=1 Tax=Sinorhizobium sp. BJ1 TaxID=2035455 RepID=UPI000BE8EB6E|nr:inorganic triphosphatase [Sinorhizobium sp. BJ1]PDT81631.1 inorganic triphosphatase [Sinorhizobium sp. BJ1]
MQEVDVKIELTESGASSLLKKDFFESTPIILQQKSVYFDTSDRDLAQRGLSLHIRQCGNERVQTVKSGDGSIELFTREEWQRPVADDSPILDDPEIGPLLSGTGENLAPMFEVHVKRHRWNVTEGDATIEVALDIGKVVAADREAPLCELELEKKSGSPEALFGLARKVNLITPAHIGVLTKAERGYRLLDPAPGAVKASVTPITPDMNAATAFAHLAATCLKQFRLNEMALSWSRNADALHQARVSLRRLRSLFSICKSLFADSRFDHMRDELRWLTSELGDARNIDVIIKRASDEGFSSRLQAARKDAYGAVNAAFSSVRARSLMIDLAEWISIKNWRSNETGEALLVQPARNFASNVLDKLWKKVANGGSDLIDLDDETRHELRISAKKLRYAAEFFGPLYKGKAKTKRHKRFIMAMEGLQDQLGSLNDIVTAPDMLAKLELSEASGAEELFSAADKEKLLDDAAEAHDIFVDTRRFWR